MSAYKNSNSNRGIANEMANWKYFSSSLAKLGTYKGATINAPLPSDNIDKKVNWLKTIGGAVGAATGLYNTYREQQYKKAEEYYNTHTMAEYKQAIQDGSIPLQDDWLAMSRLKYMTGQRIFALTSQDFKERIDNNEFQGKSPEEVDAEFHKQLRSSIKEFYGDEQLLGFNPENDYYFEKGVYDDADKTRMGMLLEHSNVENDFLTQQYQAEALTQAQALGSNEAYNADMMWEAISNAYTTDTRSSPAFQTQLLKTFVASLTNNPRGSEILRELASRKVPDLDVTLKEFMGADFDRALINAESYKYKNDAKLWYDLNVKVDDWVKTGNVQAIDAELLSHIKQNGNIQDTYYDLLLNKRASAEAVALNNLHASGKEQNLALAIEETRKYYRGYLNGTDKRTFEVFLESIDGLGLSTNQRKIVGQSVIGEVLTNSDEKSLSTVFDYLTKEGVPKDLQTAAYNVYKDSFNTLNNAINTSLETGVLPSNENQKELLAHYLRLKQAYSANPAAFLSLIGENNANSVDMFSTMNIAERVGENPVKALINTKKLTKDIQESGVDPSTFTYSPDNDLLSDIASSTSSNINKSKNLTALAKMKVLDYCKANPDVGLSEAWEAVTEQLEDTVTLVDDAFFLPNTVVRNLIPSEYQHNLDMEEVQHCLDLTFKEIKLSNKELKLKNPQDYENSQISKDNSRLLIIDAEGHLRGSISLSHLSDKVTNLMKERLNNERNSLYKKREGDIRYVYEPMAFGAPKDPDTAHLRELEKKNKQEQDAYIEEQAKQDAKARLQPVGGKPVVRQFKSINYPIGRPPIN